MDQIPRVRRWVHEDTQRNGDIGFAAGISALGPFVAALTFVLISSARIAFLLAQAILGGYAASRLAGTPEFSFKDLLLWRDRIAFGFATRRVQGLLFFLVRQISLEIWNVNRPRVCLRIQFLYALSQPV